MLLTFHEMLGTVKQRRQININILHPEFKNPHKNNVLQLHDDVYEIRDEVKKYEI